jgi:hypothetical protein
MEMKQHAPKQFMGHRRNKQKKFKYLKKKKNSNTTFKKL